MPAVRFNPTQLALTILSMRGVIDRVEKDWPLLTDREQVDEPDGFGPGGAGESGRGAGSHSDPTARAAAARARWGTKRQDLDLIQVLLATAARHLDQVDSLRAAALPPSGEKPDSDDGDGWCRSCLRLGRCNPVGDHGRTKLCSWCYGFSSEHKQQPPLELLAKHHDGVRIYDRDIREALRRRKSKSRRRAS